MPRTVHVAVYDTLADWEVGHATAHIANPAWQRDPGAYEIVTVGETGAPVRTMGGMRITPDMALADLDPADSAMLVLPGAETWLHGGNAAFAAAAGEVLAAGGAVAAICGATVGLAAAGLLDDRWHTSNAPEALAATGYAGGHRYRHEPAITDGRLITASGVEPVAFAREVLALLEVYDPPVLDAWYRLYGDHDPAGYHDLVAATQA